MGREGGMWSGGRGLWKWRFLLFSFGSRFVRDEVPGGKVVGNRSLEQQKKESHISHFMITKGKT